MTVRLILGDQLNQEHTWFTGPEKGDVCYFMAEMRQETDYTRHHIQKVVAFFKSMRNFGKWIEQGGHEVVYYRLDDEDNEQDLTKNLAKIIRHKNAKRFEYQFPDEYRLDRQLREFCESSAIPTRAYDTEHFLTSRTDLRAFYKGKKQLTMEYFYRHMRKKYDVLMVNGSDPEGGKWNFDQSNRKKWKGEPSIPPERGFQKEVSDIVALLQRQGVETMGTIEASNFDWPTSRNESVSILEYFCKNLLVHFGDYQDAMHTDERFLFHSRLSFAMNSKMLHPMEVVETVIAHWRNHRDLFDISQVEGFVRQIIGWREYMRGVYWKEMPAYRQCNELDNRNPLPDFYWTADTKMNCMHHSIKQSLEEAYAHHIQRLMVIGNYALLTMVHPDEVCDWYLGVYIDAIEWVEITNTRGMSQFADGGIIATKPYVSSGSYINKMGNYCKDCHYKVSKKTGEDACPFNALYWNFLDEKRRHFKDNQRMNMMMALLDKMDGDKLRALKERANEIIKDPDRF